MSAAGTSALNHELLSGSPSVTIPRLLSELRCCFERLMAENRILADTNAVLGTDTLASHAASVQIGNCPLADENSAVVRSRSNTPEAKQTTKSVVNLDIELELVNEANDKVEEELCASHTEPFHLDEIRRISDAVDQHECLAALAVESPTPTNFGDGPPERSTASDAYSNVRWNLRGSQISATSASSHIHRVSTSDSVVDLGEGRSKTTEDIRGQHAKRLPGLEQRGELSESNLDPQIFTNRGTLLAADSSHITVLPKWFAKQSDEPGKRSTWSITSSLHREEIEFSAGCCCILEPAGRVRLTWDACWCLLLMFEIWATPIQLVFLEDGALPEWWTTTLTVSFCFFCFDIVLNFFTGFVLNDIDIMDQRRIVHHYLKHWFVFDVIATIPWDWVVGEEHGSSLSSATAAKGLKMMRMLKLLRAAKLVRVMHSSKKANNKMSVSNVKRRRMQRDSATWSILQTMGSAILRIVTSGKTKFVVQVFSLICLLAHSHAIVWAALQDDWSATRDTQLAFLRYFESFWWAFSSFTFGNTYAASKPGLWCLDIAVLFERLILCTWIARCVVVKAVMSRANETQFGAKRREALKYMEEHDVSLKTELQVLKYWNESGKKRKRQRWFSELIQASLPLELQRRIKQELWSDKLRSLGLIEHLFELNSDFVSQLSQVVIEDTYASTMLVCKEGDPAKNAYHVISGELIVPNIDESVAPFTAGMWIGEKALVNPELRRYGSVFAKTLSTLLTVPAPAFFQLLSDLGVDENFKDFCSRELWKGLCGRCGSVGDHWADECPNVVLREQADRGSKKVSKTRKMPTVYDFGRLLTDKDTSKRKMRSDLSLFISHHKLGHIEDALEDMMILSLNDLEERFQEVQQKISNIENLELSDEQLDALTAREVRFFRSKVSAQTRAMLNTRTSSAGHHYMFLSHYKVEAGTEAALMRTELENLIHEDSEHPAYELKTPVYLDSEDLVDLHHLMDEVSSSHNLVLMLTKGILTRPWCLLEIATASRDKVPVLPVNILKAGCEFTFPDDSFYKDLGKTIGSSGVDLIKQHGFEMDDVVNSLKEVFKRIAVPYSPHRPATIRKVELQELLKQATMRDIVEHTAHFPKVPKPAVQRQTTQLSSATRRSSFL